MSPNIQQLFGISGLSLDKSLVGAVLVPLLTTLYGVYAYLNVPFQSFLNINGFGRLKDKSWAETVVHPVLLWHPFPRRTLIFGSGTRALVREALRHIATKPIYCDGADLSMDDDILNQTVQYGGMSAMDLLASSSPPFDVIILAQVESLNTIQLASERLADGGVLALALPDSWEQTLSQTLAVFKHVHLFTPYDSTGRSSYYALATNSDAFPPPTHLSVPYINTLIGRRIVHKTSLGYYDGEIHLRMFLLPRQTREILRDLYNKSSRPASSLPNFSPFLYDKNAAVPSYPKAATLTRDFVQCEKLPFSEQDATDIVVRSIKNGEATGSRGLTSYSWSTYQNITTHSTSPSRDLLDESKPVSSSAPAHLAVTAVYDGGSISLHIFPHLGYGRASITNFNSYVAPDEVLNSLENSLYATRSSGTLSTGPSQLIHSSRLDERLSHFGDDGIGSLDYWRLNYPSLISPKIDVRISSIDATGLWANSDISEGEILLRGPIEGELIHREEYEQYPAWRKTHIAHFAEQADEQILVAPVSKHSFYIWWYINHACSPNVRYDDCYDDMMALRNITAGEELSFDYATSDAVSTGYECKCGSNACRGHVSSKDWENEGLIARLGKDAFWPHLKLKILQKENGGKLY